MTSTEITTQPLPVALPFQADELHLPDGWSGYAMPQHFPIKHERERRAMMAFLWDVSLSLFAPAEAEPTAWLLMDTLHRDNAVLRLSRNAREWKPTYGLGLWPDQEPPRMLQSEDILNLEWGAKIPLPYHSVTMLRATGSALHDAWSTMFGTGSTVLTLGPGGGSALLSSTREFLKRPIVDESFQNFPFYFPLLGLNSVREATSARLDHWLGGTRLYLRESEEDNAVLLIARTHADNLREAMQRFAEAPHRRGAGEE